LKYDVGVIGSVTVIGVVLGYTPVWGARIASVTERELVLEYGVENGVKSDTWVKVRYTRKK